MPIKKLLARKPAGISLKYLAPALCWGLFILIGTVLPGSDVPRVLRNMNDKIIHATIYFVAFTLIYLAFIRYSFVNPISREFVWFIVLVCIAFGGMLELVQHYVVPSRTGDWMDFLANTCGSLIGVLGMRVLHRLKA